MAFQIVLVLSIVALAVVFFITERLRVDVVALLVLGGLALTGLVTPSEALSGFSNPAVVTVWAVFILSGGMSRTGVANIVGRQVLRLAGSGEARLVLVIMLTAGVLSAFMNNIGVAALLLPVVMDIARRTGRAPSRLLMPLAYGSLMGGLTTLIGTPPNILVSDALRDYGLHPFQLFDFAPVGLAVMLAGVLFMTALGRRLLPTRDIARELSNQDQTDLDDLYNLREQLLALQLPAASPLAGKTLEQSRLGSALGLNVVAIIRGGQTQRSPSPDTVLQANDRLLAEGKLDRLTDLRGWRQLVIENSSPAVNRLVSEEIKVAEVKLAPHSSLVGQTLYQSNFRGRFGVNVLAIRRGDIAIMTNLVDVLMQADDLLLVQGTCERLKALRQVPDSISCRAITNAELIEVYHLPERLIALSVPGDSILLGRTLLESRLGDALDLTVLGIVRQGVTHLMPSPDEPLQAGDALLMQGDPESLLTLRGLQNLQIVQGEPLELESEHVGLMEVVLSPHTTLAGKSLRQLCFREKYGLSVLAIWRGGRAYRTNLRDMALRLGDALLLYGPREKLRVLGGEPDFLILTQAAQEAPQTHKAPLAVLVMAAVLLPVIFGWLPISIAAVVGATLMVLLGCLSMEEAYRFINWKSVFLIAGMLPLGIAMEHTGAANFLAEGVVAVVGDLGGLAVVAGLFILTSLVSQVMPNAAVAVLLAPVALSTAQDLGISPYALMMTVGLSASASFLSPVAHPANLLVLGPGGYRFTDYIKVGLPLTLVTLVVTLLVLPIFWPLF